MFYDTYEEMIAAWGPRADAKLRADNVDPDDLAAVEACLTACAGGQRFFQAWVDWRKAQQVKWPDWRKAQQVKCPDCHGHGYIIDIWHRQHVCQACDGTGEASQ